MCYRCGFEEWYFYNKCVVRNAICNKCGIIGYYGIVCMKLKRNVNNVEEFDDVVSGEGDFDLFFGMVVVD